MSLSTPDQRALKSIETDLAGAAPELATLLGTFTRLAVGEEMPAWESLPKGGRYGPAHHLGRQWSLFLVWLTVTLGLIAIALTLNHGGGRGACTAVGPLAVCNYYIAPR